MTDEQWEKVEPLLLNAVIKYPDHLELSRAAVYTALWKSGIIEKHHMAEGE